MTFNTLLPKQIRFEVQLAWRHLRSGDGQTWLTIAAVASGVIIVIFIVGLIFGLRNRLSALLTDAIPHVTVQVPEGRPIPYADLRVQPRAPVPHDWRGRPPNARIMTTGGPSLPQPAPFPRLARLPPPLPGKASPPRAPTRLESR